MVIGIGVIGDRNLLFGHVANPTTPRWDRRSTALAWRRPGRWRQPSIGVEYRAHRGRLSRANFRRRDRRQRAPAHAEAASGGRPRPCLELVNSLRGIASRCSECGNGYAGWGAMGGGGPLRQAQGRAQAEMREDLLDHLRLLDERDDPHWPATPGADQRVHLVDLLDQPRPGALRRRWGCLTEVLDALTNRQTVRGAAVQVVSFRYLPPIHSCASCASW